MRDALAGHCCDMIGRRGALLGLASLAAGAAYATRPNILGMAIGLRGHAARVGLQYGSMTSAAKIAAGGSYLRALLNEASIIVPENELKWTSTERVMGNPDYRGADILADFAKANRLQMRGHTGFWFRGIPSWAVPIMQGSQGTDLALKRIQSVMTRYRGRLVEWDVVNEIIEPRDRQADSLRLAPFMQSPGLGFIGDCFHAAHAADPDARLFYNEYGIEYDGPGEDARRAAVLALLSKLVARGVPIHGLGVQSHLSVDGKFSGPKFRSFLASVAAMGLQIRLTEFDVNDRALDADVRTRDLKSADAALHYLQVAFDEPAVVGLLTWGMVDGESWLIKNPQGHRLDGMPVRTLPLDDQFIRKPLWQAIARAFDGAPPRANRLVHSLDR